MDGYAKKQLNDTAETEALAELACCRLCPRSCAADRLHGQAGFCRMTGPELLVARAAPHFWEEPCISGSRGSGAVFFSGCTLACCYCQNQAISRGGAGRPVSVARLAEIFLELQAKGVHNLNLVTGTHYLPQIRLALAAARARGLSLPVVWNTSGYERPETLRLLAADVDIWLADMKYASPTLAGRFSSAPDYPETALAAIETMHALAGPAEFDEEGLMRRGLIVRHLLLPGYLADSRRVLRALFARFGNAVCYSLMRQYTPGGTALPGTLSRRVTAAEYEKLLDFAFRLGIENGFVQEEGAAEEGFVPAWDGEGT